jgi:hypothetical protein
MNAKTRASTKNAVTYLTVTDETDAELRAQREAAARQRIEDDVTAILDRMSAAEEEALAVWVALDDAEDDEDIHALGSLMRLTHLRGVWAGGLMDLRAARWRGETDVPLPTRPPVFTVVDEIEARRIAYR